MKERWDHLIKETFRHYEILEKAFKEIDKIKPLPLSDRDIIELRKNLNTLSLLDTIAYRFSKLQEDTSKLLRIYLILQGEEVEALFMRDIVNLAEKRGLAIYWEQWVAMRELRNILTHEYPQQEKEIAEALNKVKDFMVDLYKLILQLKEGI